MPPYATFYPQPPEDNQLARLNLDKRQPIFGPTLDERYPYFANSADY